MTTCTSSKSLALQSYSSPPFVDFGALNAFCPIPGRTRRGLHPTEICFPPLRICRSRFISRRELSSLETRPTNLLSERTYLLGFLLSVRPDSPDSRDGPDAIVAQTPLRVARNEANRSNLGVYPDEDGAHITHHASACAGWRN